MDVCIVGRCHSSLARPFGAKDRRMQISYTPLVSRRPSTSYVGRQAFSPSPRIQSAQSRATMATPRTQVSMAGFYDWSTEEFDEQSMSSVYQKIASQHKTKLNKATKPWCADGVHVSPGRMFVRDKADLTKGEREIIAGIYKNRGDLSNNAGSGRPGCVSHVRSHKDAWLIGKHAASPRKAANSMEAERCAIKVPEHLFSRIELPAQKISPREQHTQDYMCEKCKDNCCLSGHCLKSTPVSRGQINVFGRKAPPSSPDDSPLTARKQPTNPKATEGAVFVESGKTFYDAGSKKKKVYVDVFLPKFPTPGLNEEPTNLNNDDPEDDPGKSKVGEAPVLFKISEQYTEHSDEGYSSQERSPLSKERPQRSPALKSRSSGKSDLGSVD